MPLATNADVDERATCLNRNIKEVLFFTPSLDQMSSLSVVLSKFVKLTRIDNLTFILRINS